MTPQAKRDVSELCRVLLMHVDRLRAEVSRVASEPDVDTMKAAIRGIVRETPIIADRIVRE